MMYNVSFRFESRDCDGPMVHEKERTLDHAGLVAELGQSLLSYGAPDIEHYSPQYQVYFFSRETEDGYRSVRMRVTEI